MSCPNNGDTARWLNDAAKEEKVNNMEPVKRVLQDTLDAVAGYPPSPSGNPNSMGLDSAS